MGFVMTSHTIRPLSGRTMQIAERRLPELSAKAGCEAYKNALSRIGSVVVETSRGQIVERRSDGTFTVIKQLPMGKRVKPGMLLKRVKDAGSQQTGRHVMPRRCAAPKSELAREA
jgi:hypothetical protein